jgi:hypothetical protein
MKDPLRLLQTLCGIGLVGALMFSWLWAFPFYNRITISRNREQYQSRNFLVRDAVYSTDSESGTSSWLVGTVEGKEERLVPARRGAAAPKSKRELMFKYPVGTNIPVLYNAQATEMLVQGESLRAIESTPDFWEKEDARRHRLAWYVLLPVPLALSLFLGVKLARRRREQAKPA